MGAEGGRERQTEIKKIIDMLSGRTASGGRNCRQKHGESDTGAGRGVEVGVTSVTRSAEPFPKHT